MNTMPMAKEEMVKRLKEGCEAEPYFPGVLGNPVTFAARWGLPLSKSYMAHLAAKRRKAPTVNLLAPASARPP